MARLRLMIVTLAAVFCCSEAQWPYFFRFLSPPPTSNLSLPDNSPFAPERSPIFPESNPSSPESSPSYPQSDPSPSENTNSAQKPPSFKAIIKKAIESNSALRNQFNISLPGDKCYHLVYQFALEYYLKLHACDPEGIAKNFAEVSYKKFDGAPISEIIELCITSVKSILEQLNVFSKDNEVHLASKYLHYLNEQRSLPDYDGTPASNLKTLYFSCLHLIQDIAPNVPDVWKTSFDVWDKSLRALPECYPKDYVVEIVPAQLWFSVKSGL